MAVVYFTRRLYIKFRYQWTYYVCLCKANLLPSALMFGHKLAEYNILYLLILYLTGSLTLRKAAMFNNYHEGLASALVLIMTYILHTFLGRLKLIILSAITFIGGLVFLYFISISTTLPEYNIPIFNFIALTLLAIGDAGMKTFLEELLADQLRHHEDQRNMDEDRVMARKRVWWLVAVAGAALAAYLTYDYTWSIAFLFTACVMGGGLVLFLFGIPFYHQTEPDAASNPFSMMLKVLKAAVRKRRLDSNQLYQKLDNEEHIEPQIKLLRWIDKAAMIDSCSDLNPEDQEMTGKLFPVKQVRNCKLLLKMVPLWTTFLVFNLTISTGGTFFPEQTSNMKSQGFIMGLVVIQKGSSGVISYLANLVVSKYFQETKFRVRKMRIIAGMILSPVCFVIAWKIEIRRLRITRDNEVLDFPDEIIPMSIFWLVPQFLILGLMEGLAVKGLDELLIDEFQSTWEDYISAINEFVVGLGSFLSIFTLHLKKNLFARTLNRSRLDEYYKILFIVSLVNVVYNWFILRLYRSSYAVEEEEEEEEKENGSRAVNENAA